MSIISIFGLAGTGTSSCGKLLAEKLGYDFISAGSIVRELAKERGVSVHEHDKIMEEDSSIDQKLDGRIAEIGKTHKNLVIESRLGWYFVPDSIKIKFICSDEARYERVADRDGISALDAEKESTIRENSHLERFKKAYGINDYSADEHFDLIIDTTNISVEEVVDKIFEYLKKCHLRLTCVI